MGSRGLLEFFCNLTFFCLSIAVLLTNNKLKILLLARLIKKKKIKGALVGLVVDSGKNCVAHDTIYTILAALFCLV